MNMFEACRRTFGATDKYVWSVYQFPGKIFTVEDTKRDSRHALHFAMFMNNSAIC